MPPQNPLIHTKPEGHDRFKTNHIKSSSSSIADEMPENIKGVAKHVTNR